MPEITTIPLPLPPSSRKPWVFFDGEINDGYAVFRAEPPEENRCIILTFRHCPAVCHRHVPLESQADYAIRLPDNSVSELSYSPLLRNWSPGFGVSLGLFDYPISWDQMKHYAVKIGYMGVWDFVARRVHVQIFEGDERAAIHRCLELSHEWREETDRFWAAAAALESG